MTPRSTALLALAGVLALAGGWFFGLRPTQTEQTSLAAGQRAFPDLTGQLAQATAIDIRRGGKALLLRRQGDGWVLPAYGNYPARPETVHELLADLSALRLVEPRTAAAADYGRLGVEDPTRPAAFGTALSVLGAGGAPLASVIIGRSREAGPGDAPARLYVRKPAEAQSWLAEGALPAAVDFEAWVDLQILSIDPADIASVSVSRDGGRLLLTRDGDKLVLREPATHPPLDDNRVQDITRALDMLTFADVRAAGPLPGSALGQAVFITKTGLTITAQVNAEANRLWAHFAAAGATPAATTAAAALNAKLAAWSYALPLWKQPGLLPKLDDLTVPPPLPAAATRK
jgi:hypothetical protein